MMHFCGRIGVCAPPESPGAIGNRDRLRPRASEKGGALGTAQSRLLRSREWIQRTHLHQSLEPRDLVGTTANAQRKQGGRIRDTEAKTKTMSWCGKTGDSLKTLQWWQAKVYSSAFHTSQSICWKQPRLFKWTGRCHTEPLTKLTL